MELLCPSPSPSLLCVFCTYETFWKFSNIQKIKSSIINIHMHTRYVRLNLLTFCHTCLIILGGIRSRLQTSGHFTLNFEVQPAFSRASLAHWVLVGSTGPLYCKAMPVWESFLTKSFVIKRLGSQWPGRFLFLANKTSKWTGPRF